MNALSPRFVLVRGLYPVLFENRKESQSSEFERTVLRPAHFPVAQKPRRSHSRADIVDGVSATASIILPVANGPLLTTDGPAHASVPGVTDGQLGTTTTSSFRRRRQQHLKHKFHTPREGVVRLGHPVEVRRCDVVQ